MSDLDPLADVLEAAKTSTVFNEDGSTSVYFNDGAYLARVAREHIAKEIEASIDGREPQNNAARWIRDGKRIAASLARREND